MKTISFKNLVVGFCAVSVCFLLVCIFAETASAENFLNKFGKDIGVSNLLDVGLTNEEIGVKEFWRYAMESGMLVYSDYGVFVPPIAWFKEASRMGRITGSRQDGNILTVYTSSGTPIIFRAARRLTPQEERMARLLEERKRIDAQIQEAQQ